MRMRLFIAFSIIIAAGSVLAQAYRWVDEDGVVHYSDKPTPGAEQIELPKDDRVAARQQPSRTRPVREQPEAEPPTDSGVFRYERLAVAAPASDETLWNIEGVLNVRLDLQPGLQEGHRVRIYFDGSAQMVDSTAFQIQEVYRGSHNLQAEVVDQTGRLMIRSVPSRFFVQQTTVIRAN
jgi:hypothetical protein